MEKKKRKIAIATFLSFFASRSCIPPADATATLEETVKEESTIPVLRASPKFRDGSKFSVVMAGTSAVIVGGAVLRRTGNGNINGEKSVDDKKKEFESIIGIQAPDSEEVEMKMDQEVFKKISTNEEREEAQEKLQVEVEPELESLDQEAIEKSLREKELEEQRAKIKAAAVAKTIAEATKKAREEAAVARTIAETTKRAKEEAIVAKSIAEAKKRAEEEAEARRNSDKVNEARKKVEEQIVVAEKKYLETQKQKLNVAEKKTEVPKVEIEVGKDINQEKREKSVKKELPVDSKGSTNPATDPVVNDNVELTQEETKTKMQTEVEDIKPVVKQESDLKIVEKSVKKNVSIDTISATSPATNAIATDTIELIPEEKTEAKKQVEVEDIDPVVNKKSDQDAGETNVEKKLLIDSEDTTNPATGAIATDTVELIPEEKTEAKKETKVEDIKPIGSKESDFKKGETNVEKTSLIDSKSATSPATDTMKLTPEEKKGSTKSKDLGEAAFDMLLDLGMIERSRDPDDIDYDHSDDNEYI